MPSLAFLVSSSSSFFSQRWSGPEKLLALDELIDRCEPPQIKHMMQVIEPQFQRDFISLLPKEVNFSEVGLFGGGRISSRKH